MNTPMEVHNDPVIEDRRMKRPKLEGHGQKMITFVTAANNNGNSAHRPPRGNDMFPLRTPEREELKARGLDVLKQWQSDPSSVSNTELLRALEHIHLVSQQNQEDPLALAKYMLLYSLLPCLHALLQNAETCHVQQLVAQCCAILKFIAKVYDPLAILHNGLLPCLVQALYEFPDEVLVIGRPTMEIIGRIVQARPSQALVLIKTMPHFTTAMLAIFDQSRKHQGGAVMMIAMNDITLTASNLLCVTLKAVVSDDGVHKLPCEFIASIVDPLVALLESCRWCDPKLLLSTIEALGIISDNNDESIHLLLHKGITGILVRVLMACHGKPLGVDVLKVVGAVVCCFGNIASCAEPQPTQALIQTPHFKEALMWAMELGWQDKRVYNEQRPLPQIRKLMVDLYQTNLFLLSNLAGGTADQIACIFRGNATLFDRIFMCTFASVQSIHCEHVYIVSFILKNGHEQDKLEVLKRNGFRSVYEYFASTKYSVEVTIMLLEAFDAMFQLSETAATTTRGDYKQMFQKHGGVRVLDILGRDPCDEVRAAAKDLLLAHFTDQNDNPNGHHCDRPAEAAAGGAVSRQLRFGEMNTK